MADSQDVQAQQLDPGAASEQEDDKSIDTEEQKRRNRAKERRRERVEEKREVRSLAKMVETKLLDDLSSCITAESRRSTFACGGILDLWDKSAVKYGDNKDNIPPVSSELKESVDVRFGASGEGVLLRLPHHTAASAEFQRLLAECQPVSFGRGAEEVLDEDYRKAGKLDCKAFATSFCPYEAGIVDVVSQLLLPQTRHDKHSHSIRVSMLARSCAGLLVANSMRQAELYKLNVYSAPSGKFKAHVDTQRSENQIGSLVVCLPMSHEGSQLAV